MTIEKMLEKVQIGISPLTGSLAVFYPDSDGFAKYKKNLTGNFKETKELLMKLLKSIENYDKEYGDNK